MSCLPENRSRERPTLPVSAGARGAGCYARMATREEALTELSHVFAMIAEEYQEREVPLPEGTSEIVNA